MIIAHQTDRRHRFDAGVFMERDAEQPAQALSIGLA
jgi:hypothetical protein